MERMGRFFSKSLFIVKIFLLLFVLLSASVGVCYLFGEFSLYRAGKADATPYHMAAEQRYQGDTYRYNDSLLIFYVMGIDKERGEGKRIVKSGGGQSDANFLVVFNPKDDSLSVIAVNRNAMTEIVMYDGNGKSMGTVKAQLAIQHGFGGGLEDSCGYQVKAMQNLMKGIPIHGYCAVNMSAISTINDSVGGVDVTVLEDIDVSDTYFDVQTKFTSGETIHLMGDDAFWYVKYRNHFIYGTADKRLDRQKQYLKAFIPKAKEKIQEDIFGVVALYRELQDEIVTDLTSVQLFYLLTQVKKYNFHEEQIYYLQGETVMGEEFEEFHVDEEALGELIRDVFYEKITG